MSEGNEKAVLFTKGEVIIKSYCSLPGNCPSQERCQSCETLDRAKKHLKNKTLNSNVKILDGELSVGIGEYKIGKRALLQAMGRGSCIGIFLFDASTGIGGIAHILLPGASKNGETKYAETAIDKMLEDMIKLVARRSKIVSKFAGGAQVFKHMTWKFSKSAAEIRYLLKRLWERKKFQYWQKMWEGKLVETLFLILWMEV